MYVLWQEKKGSWRCAGAGGILHGPLTHAVDASRRPSEFETRDGKPPSVRGGNVECVESSVGTRAGSKQEYVWA